MTSPPDAYDALPESLKAAYTREQYLWLGDADKARLLQTETEPDEEP